MTHFPRPLACVLGIVLLTGAWIGAGCTKTTTNNNGGAGGKSSSGGSSSNGGSSSTGGSSSNGGSSSSGGSSNNGGSSNSGGSPSSGGSSSTGGSSSNGGTAGTSETGGAGGSGGTAGAGSGGTGSGGTTSTGTGCPTIWDWEGTTADNWASTDTDVTVAVSTTQKFAGTQSLKATIPALTSAASGDAAAAAVSRTIAITPPTSASSMWPGATITVHVWVPAEATKAWVQLFTLSNNWANWNNSTSISPTAGDWTTLTFTVPAAAAVFPGGHNQFGVQFGIGAGSSFAGGDIYIDAITVCGGTQSCSGSGTGSFDFETAGATDGWAFKGESSVKDTVVTQSTDLHYGGTGKGALKVGITDLPAAPSPTSWTSRLVELPNPKAYCGQTVTYHVYADKITGLSVQPYASANGWAWFAGTSVTLATSNTWTDVTFTLPSTINFLGLQAVGLQLSNTSTTDTYSGTMYIDGITWQ